MPTRTIRSLKRGNKRGYASFKGGNTYGNWTRLNHRHSLWHRHTCCRLRCTYHWCTRTLVVDRLRKVHRAKGGCVRIQTRDLEGCVRIQTRDLEWCVRTQTRYSEWCVRTQTRATNRGGCQGCATIVNHHIYSWRKISVEEGIRKHHRHSPAST